MSVGTLLVKDSGLDLLGWEEYSVLPAVEFQNWGSALSFVAARPFNFPLWQRSKRLSKLWWPSAYPDMFLIALVVTEIVVVELEVVIGVCPSSAVSVAAAIACGVAIPPFGETNVTEVK